MVELLKQPQFAPFEIGDQVLSIYAGTQGLLDELAESQVRDFEKKMLAHFKDEFPEIGEEIVSKGQMSEELAEKIKTVVTNFRTQYLAAAKA